MGKVNRTSQQLSTFRIEYQIQLDRTVNEHYEIRAILPKNTGNRDGSPKCVLPTSQDR